MDDPEFREIVIGFVRRLGDQLENMRTALADNDLLELRSLAHWLKGAGGTVGFAAFYEPARKLEELAKAGQCDGVEPLLDELDELAASIQLPGEEAAPLLLMEETDDLLDRGR